MKQAIILILFLSITLFSCKDDNEGVEMSIVETGCMNAWGDYYEDTSDYKHAVKAYLNHNGIKVYNVTKFNYYSGAVCLACYCSTGNLIIVRIRETDVAKAEELGFQLIVDGQLNIPGES